MVFNFHRRLQIFSFLIYLLALTGCETEPSAPKTSERVDLFWATLDFRPGNGVVEITEVIDLFVTGRMIKEGFARRLPKRYFDDQGKEHLIKYNIIGASRNLTPISMPVLKSADEKSYKLIVKVDKGVELVTGTHRFVVKYQVDGNVRSTLKNNYFNWRLFGGFPVPVKAVFAEVFLPGGLKLLDCEGRPALKDVIEGVKCKKMKDGIPEGAEVWRLENSEVAPTVGYRIKVKWENQRIAGAKVE